MHDRARIYWRSRYALQASGVEVDFGMSPLDFVNFSDENSMAFQHIDDALRANVSQVVNFSGLKTGVSATPAPQVIL